MDPEADLSSPEFYINRELSWLDFNRRVLEEARDETNPLLERVKFLAIVANNLDEFFEVRVAGLQQLCADDSPATGPDRLTPAEQLQRVSARTHELVREQYRCWNEELLPALAREHIHLWEARKLKGDHLKFIKKYWKEELEPVLTPIVIDPAHPFPRVLNKALCIAALLQPGRGQRSANRKNHAQNDYQKLTYLSKKGKQVRVSAVGLCTRHHIARFDFAQRDSYFVFQKPS